LNRFQVTASYLSKATDFNLPNLHMVPPSGDDHMLILAISLATENSSLQAIVWRCLRDLSLTVLIQNWV